MKSESCWPYLGVLVIRGQPNRNVDDRAFIRFLRSLGELMFTVGETPVPGFGDLNVVTNVGRTTPPRSVFHTDTSYVRRPPAYTALRAVSVPTRGGATLFSNQYVAYETLPAQLRAELAGRTVRHVATGVTLDDSEESVSGAPVVPRASGIRAHSAFPVRAAALRRRQRHVTGARPRHHLISVSITPRARTTSTATSGGRATWSSGTTARSCTAPITPTWRVIASCTGGWSPTVPRAAEGRGCRSGS